MAYGLLAGVALAAAAVAPPGADQLSSLSIEELAQIEVTSASRRAEPLSGTPASLFVITNEDILRWGGSSLPEVLRMAPQLDVQRIDARQYAVTARGFQGAETANKTLVQIDGRSIYSTLAATVFYELFDTPLEDIDRIEVISGPGGTLYGTNAVNGVINIMTKDARDTHGLLARATGASLEQTALLRYGAPIGSNGGIRIYAEGWNRRGFPKSGNRNLRDGSEGWQTGFRADFGGDANHFTVQGDLFEHNADSGKRDGDNGQNILARWTNMAESGAQTQVQAYYSRFARRFTLVYDRLETSDIAVQHNRSEGRHALVFGGGVRMVRDRFNNNLNPFVLDPEAKTLWILNGFAQDRVDMGGGLAVTAGLKAEKTTFTGLELLPNLRLAWQPRQDLLLWAAASRAVREPSRIDRDLTHPIILRAGTFRAEELTAFELGYRGQPASNLTISVTGFYNLYDRLRTTKVTPVTILPVQLANGIKGENWGVEAWGAWQVAHAVRLNAGVTVLDGSFRLRKGETDLENFISLGNDPDYFAQLGGRVDFTSTLGFDFQVRRYGSRPNPRVPAYTDADARLGWRFLDSAELFLSGTNLLHARRDESADPDRGQLVRRIVALGVRFGL
ncbi:TonB-dependent receptor [Sphingomonas sp. ID1715]|uniref:TonB-dependent receptor plug domain-containing protein n=1 Tax=Sphingomonas sp. ID1715 TaxID=1656898 RepID=UPI0014896228|nr:TonB-dependent receptor [Sphingomonas sp. ID1715]NNM75947.1 TonB-dependent receptor [Sphingomonas sp. ID1715]